MQVYKKVLVGLVGLMSAWTIGAGASEVKKSAATKPAIILIHAFPTDHRLYEPQVNDLKKQFNVIAVDLKGFGKAPAADGNAITMADYATQVKEIMDTQHIDKAIIGGVSMGGYVTLAFLKQYPNQVRGIILSDTQAIADTEEAKTKRETNATNVLKNGTSQLVKDFLPTLLSPNADQHLVVFLQDIMASQSPQGVASALRGMALREDTSQVLSAAKVPTLILAGEKDVIISPEQSKKMHDLLPGSKLVVIPNAGHLSSLEQPKVWNQAVREVFLK